MKQIAIVLISILLSSSLMAAGGDSGGDSSKDSLYDDAIKLVKRAGKLEKKEKLLLNLDQEELVVADC